MRPQLAWWVCRYWLIPQRCLSSHKTNKACLYLDQTAVATETGRGPRIYRNHMQMVRHHVVLLEQEGDRWMHVHTRESEFPCPFLFESSLISYKGYPFPHFIWIFTLDPGFGNVSPPHVFYSEPLKAHYFTAGCARGARVSELRVGAVLIKLHTAVKGWHGMAHSTCEAFSQKHTTHFLRANQSRYNHLLLKVWLFFTQLAQLFYWTDSDIGLSFPSSLQETAGSLHGEMAPADSKWISKR